MSISLRGDLRVELSYNFNLWRTIKTGLYRIIGELKE
jgi:hypothetical protein